MTLLHVWRHTLLIVSLISFMFYHKMTKTVMTMTIKEMPRQVTQIMREQLELLTKLR